MKRYRIVIVLLPHLVPEPLDGEGPFITRDIDTSVEAGGYYLTDPTGTFLELSPQKGIVEVYPLAHVVQLVIEDITPDD